MKRIACLMLAVICMFSLIACGAKETNYEQSLFEASDEIREYIEKDVANAKQQGVDFNIAVNRISKNVYEVTFNGDKQKNEFYEESQEEFNLEQVCELDSKYQSIATKARDSVIKYINTSNILKDKEKLIESINQIQVKVAIMDSVGLHREGTVYISKDFLANFPASASEYALAHEYIHALAAITNNGVDNEVYGKNQLNEAITDIITVQLYPEGSGFESAYSDYYYYVLGYISCFKEKAVEAYFYGYDDIWESTGRDDFDFFVEMFAKAPYDVYAHMYTTALINKWFN